MATKLHASIIVTYRCNAKCNMCEVWKNTTKPSEEIGLDIIEKLPNTLFTNITGGELFVREDLPGFVRALRKKLSVLSSALMDIFLIELSAYVKNLHIWVLESVLRD